MKTILGLLLAIALGASPAHASSLGTDLNDWWYTAGEDGWAINVAHQHDTVFIAWYLYRPDRAPVWYSGSAPLSSAAVPGQVFAGDLYETNGPWFGGAFNASTLTYRKVGTFTFNPRAQDQALLTYTVDSVTVDKTLRRFLFRYNSVAGTYVSWNSSRTTGCANPADNGRLEDDIPLTITHGQDNSVTLVAGLPPEVCTVAGRYEQTGRLGRITGALNCPGVPVGDFELSEIAVSTAGLMGKLTILNGTCRQQGNFAAARLVP